MGHSESAPGLARNALKAQFLASPYASFFSVAISRFEHNRDQTVLVSQKLHHAKACRRGLAAVAIVAPPHRGLDWLRWLTSFPALTAPTRPTKSRRPEQWRRDTR